MARPIEAEIMYLAPINGPAVHHIFPQSSGKTTRRPPNDGKLMTVTDARDTIDQFTLDDDGFAFLTRPSAFNNFFSSPERIREHYYRECAEIVGAVTGASEVIGFDHNLRSRARAEAGFSNMNEPVRFCHNDYTHASGPKRIAGLLDQDERQRLRGKRTAIINVWRPLMEPVEDKPLALCVASSMDAEDLVATEIRHYKDESVVDPAHRGEIYSVKFNPQHRWVYLSKMRSDEIILIKCYDSLEDGRARFTPHTAIDLPDLSPAPPMRESIEVRTVAFFE